MQTIYSVITTGGKCELALDKQFCLSENVIIGIGGRRTLLARI